MNYNSELISINEGDTCFLVHNNKQKKNGPGSKNKNLPFYNPSMELNRDLSVILCQWLVNNRDKTLKIIDGLAASGARGLRIKNEVNGDFELVINDWDEQAYKLINKNVKNNKLKNVETSNKNLNTLLSDKNFDYIDIDPFGSPVYFVDSAIRSIKNNGIIACTATDTAALCGVYSNVCKRRYGATPIHSYFMKEVGIRILLGFICRESAKYDKGIKPILSYSTDHYFRVYVMIKKGVNSAYKSISSIECVDSADYEIFNKKNKKIGPLWTGKTQYKKIIEELRSILFEKNLNTKSSLWKLFDLLEEEADSPCFFYSTDEIASNLKKSPPKINDVLEKISGQGYKVSRTHFSNTGFKTDAPENIILNIFR